MFTINKRAMAVCGRELKKCRIVVNENVFLLTLHCHTSVIANCYYQMGIGSVILMFLVDSSMVFFQMLVRRKAAGFLKGKA